MDNKENGMTKSPENKLNLKLYRKDIYFIAFLITLIILFPFGVLFYIWGRMNLMIHSLIIALFFIFPSMLIFIFISFFRLFIKNTWKKKIFIFTEIFLSAMFFILYFIPVDMKLNLYDSSHPFLCGYRDRIRGRLDVKAVRDWMKTYSENYNSRNNNEIIDEYITPDKLPDCLKTISYGGIFKFFRDIDGKPEIVQFCGASMSHWSLTIGMEDTPFPDSEFYKEQEIFWLPVAPGIYVRMD